MADSIPEHEMEASARLNVLTLYDELDTLWERYLEFLDQYHIAQMEMQGYMKSGYISLAEANFKSGERRKYGQDCYDNRMKASRRLHILHPDGSEPFIALAKGASASATLESSNGMATVIDDEPIQQPSPPSTPPPAEGATHYLSDDKGSKKRDSEKLSTSESAAKLPPDPLRWFGVLVIPKLRAVQSSFSSAMNTPLIRAVNAAGKMKVLEAEIRKLRKVIRRVEKATTE